jgi:Spy/CpxP family protein refolding chaperone
MYSLKILTMALFLISLATASAYATRQEWASSREHDEMQAERFEQLVQALALTPPQQHKIQAIISERKQELLVLRDENRVHREGVRKLFAAEVLDETHLRQLVERQADLNFRKLVARHAARSRINQVLTVEQRQKREAFLEQRRKHARVHNRGFQTTEGPP